ncbi:roadblock/LC7 domain-containing protein [Thermodesulfobacteriota bacterium]
MIFEDIIKNIVTNVNGCYSGIMMGIDGVMVESYKEDISEEDLSNMSIEFANILRDICSSSEQLETGVVQEITIKTEKITYLIRMINDEYFLALVLNPLGNYGKARYFATKSIPDFMEEL